MAEDDVDMEICSNVIALHNGGDEVVVANGGGEVGCFHFFKKC